MLQSNGEWLVCADMTKFGACHPRLPVRPISRLEQPEILAKTGKILWDLKGYMNAGGHPAVREITDEANPIQGGHCPAEDYMKSLFADTLSSSSFGSGAYDTRWMYMVPLDTG
jgi:hypothetical protein